MEEGGGQKFGKTELPTFFMNVPAQVSKNKEKFADIIY